MSFFPMKMLTMKIPAAMNPAQNSMAGIISIGSRIISTIIGDTNSHPQRFIA